ncbi:MAG: alpha/beta hydrolase fold domain-containing protein [Lachnospiraceae bacterium]|nr:alpha/beta hydrolase fold domain-containing protein [Lachnospiraceae bacterium]
MSKGISRRKLKMDKEMLKKQVLKARKQYFHKLPSFVEKKFDITELKDAGCKSYRMVPKTGFDGEFIIYIYGSGMCHNISVEQWKMISNLALETGKGLYVPMYPLAPESSCRELFEMLRKSYANFSKSFDVDKIILLGDSSGAGLALSLTHLAWEDGLRKPDQLILLSPAMDTEFFDKELEYQVSENIGFENRYFFSEGAKDFINTYWVKDYAVKTLYTSPYYEEDLTDICDDMVIFSGTYDMFNCYARNFYNRAKAQGINVRFFEFEEENHNFIVHSKSQNALMAYKYLVDVVAGTYKASLPDLLPLKSISDWTKTYPEVMKDEWTLKFIFENKSSLSGAKIPKIKSEYKNMITMARYSACDQMVKQYIKKYPNCTVINIGCRLDNMFKRVDNGRIKWYSIDTHNTMAVRRRMYGVNSRETTVGRSECDLSWINEINCKRNQGVLFVCNDAFNYMSPSVFRMMFDTLLEKYPGCEMIFTTTTKGVAFGQNLRPGKGVFKKRKRKLAIDDAHKFLSGWNLEYKVMDEIPLKKYLEPIKEKKLMTKLKLGYNGLTLNHKIIRAKFGSEKYEIHI